KPNRSTPPVSPMPSSSHAFRHLPAPTTATMKRACWYVPPISSPTRRSALSAQSQCTLLRIRRSRDEQATRLCFAGRSHRTVSAVLLEQYITAYPARDPLSQHHVKRTTMDRQSLQQYFSRRA